MVLMKAHFATSFRLKSVRPRCIRATRIQADSLHCANHSTANLIKIKCKVKDKWLCPLPFDTPTVVHGVTVTLLDANQYVYDTADAASAPTADQHSSQLPWILPLRLRGPAYVPKELVHEHAQAQVPLPSLRRYVTGFPTLWALLMFLRHRLPRLARARRAPEIGRASCRERVS